MNDILSLHAYFSGMIAEGFTPANFQGAVDFLDIHKWKAQPRIRFSAGWGTLLTNDFRDCHPQGVSTFDPLSLVCKLASAEGKSAVKLSDNPQKATGPANEIEHYKKIFGNAGMAETKVIV